MAKWVGVLLGASLLAGQAQAQAQTAPSPLRPDQASFRALYKELVETNTTLSAGSCTLAAERMAVRLKAAGMPADRVNVFFTSQNPKEGSLSRSIPVLRKSSSRSCCSPISTWSKPTAPIGPAIPSP